MTLVLPEMIYTLIARLGAYGPKTEPAYREERTLLENQLIFLDNKAKSSVYALFEDFESGVLQPNVFAKRGSEILNTGKLFDKQMLLFEAHTTIYNNFIEDSNQQQNPIRGTETIGEVMTKVRNKMDFQKNKYLLLKQGITYMVQEYKHQG